MSNCRHVLFVLSLLAVLTGCACHNSERTASVEHFPFVNAPAVMSDEQKLDYLAEHFWDSFFKKAKGCADTDSTTLGPVPRIEVEQAVANYIALLLSQPLAKAQSNAASFAEALIGLEQADTSGTVFEQLSDLFEKYMFDPNSPVRDEDIYAGYAGEMASFLDLPVAKRASYLEDARLSSLNVRGSKAADFSFCDRSGRSYTLYGITAERTILFFSNPGCTACKEIIETIKAVPGLDDAISSGRIAVLNIYIDEDIAAWLDYMPIYPKSWYNGYDYDHMIRGNELYNVRAIPSLYLLDENKTVLLKDVPVERLINNLTI